uniref:RNA dependent RNA polymerase n=1 Tax=Potato virus H TaxID=1046402 RepID=A0A346CP42_9VIRU|nr:RNA dependent RNA polymerase [Potato virus H]
MALTYRSPLEDIVAAFDPAVQSSISNTAAQSYKELEQENFSLFNYALTAKAKERLSTAGIYLSPYSAVPHSHPVCKTLENHMLYKVLPSYIDNRFYFVGIKNFKLELLKKRSKNLDLVSCINRYVTSADKMRYGSEFVRLQSEPCRSLVSKRVVLDNATLRGLLPHAMLKGAKHLFIHDELHYWCKTTLITFLEELQPEVVLATIVVPPEVLSGSKHSLNKWCYEYEICGKKMYFYPDGVRAEGYEQPLSAAYLLKCNRVHLKDGQVYCVDIVCSKFAHHLVCLTRGDAVVPSRRAYGPFEATSARGLANLSADAKRYIPVNFDVMSKVYRYLRTLKKPDVQSAMAKLSQILPNPTGFEIKFMSEFADLVIDTKGVHSLICPNRLTLWLGKVGAVLPAAIRDRLAVVKEVSLDEFVTWFEPYSLNVELVGVSRSSLEYISCLFDGAEPVREESPVALLEKFSTGGNCAELRVGSPYVGMARITGEITSALSLSNAQLVRLCATLYVRAFSRRGESMPKLADLQIIRQCFDNACMIFPRKHASKAFEQAGFWHRVQLSAQAKLARHARVAFSHGAFAWFLARRRLNVHCIKDTEEKPRTVREVSAAWAIVVFDVLSKKESDLPWIDLHTASVNEKGLGEGPTEGGTCTRTCAIHQTVGALQGRALQHVELNAFTYNMQQLWGNGEVLARSAAYGEMQRLHPSIEILEWPVWLDQYLEVVGLDSSFNLCLTREVVGGGLGLVRAHNWGVEITSESVAHLCLAGTGMLTNSTVGCTCELSMHAGVAVEVSSGIEYMRSTLLQPDKGTYRDVLLLRLNCRAPEADAGVIASVQNEEEASESLKYQALGAEVTVGQITSLPAHAVRSVPGDGDCFWHCLEEVLDMNHKTIKKVCVERLRALSGSISPEILVQMEDGESACDELIAVAASLLGLRVEIYNMGESQLRTFSGERVEAEVKLKLENEHFSLLLPTNNCVVRAVSSALKRSEADVLRVVSAKCARPLVEKIWEGAGVSIEELELVFKCFGVRAHVNNGAEGVVINEGGNINCCFEVSGDHIEHVARKKTPSSELLVGHKACRGVDPKAISELALAGTSLELQACKLRANVLATCLLEGRTGAFSSELFNGKSSLLPRDVEQVDVKPVIVHAIMGTFGAGKSNLFRKFMAKCLGRKVTYVSPRKVLAECFKKLVGMDGKQGRDAGVGTENWVVATFEAFLHTTMKVESGQALIFDEIQLYPPGYLDLVLHLIPSGVHIFLVGDPCQSEYDNEQDRAIFADSQPDIVRLLENTGYKYVTGSYRFQNPEFKGRLPCDFLGLDENAKEELYVLREGIERLAEVEEKYKEVFLVSSFEEKKLVKCYSSIDAKVLTFGESTGSTFDYLTLVITRVSTTASERRWLTALSRARRGLYIINATGLGLEGLLMSYAQRSLGKFLTGKASQGDIERMLPGKPAFQTEFYQRLGKDEGVMEEKLQGDPWLKTMLDLLQMPDVEEAEGLAEAMQEEWFKTHLPQCELESVRARWVHKILAKEAREKRMGMLVSEQFTDEHSKNKGMQLTNACERFETIYPRHKASDTVTFIMAVKKRLRFSNPKEMAKLHEAGNYGRYLLEIFLKKVPLRREHNTEMMAQAKREFEIKKTSKSAATIENHSGRSCRDWLIDIGLIFSKSQICTKFDNRFRDAKAAQTIVCFQHSVLCRFAPYMRYIEKKLHEALPKRFYIHSGKGLEELNDWVIEGKFEGCCTESDYEAFDASQDQYIMAFEIEVMKYLGLPSDLIADYKFIKTHLGSKLGNFAIMRFSGEASTFLFNTMANMLFTFMRYALAGDEYICFAGDDMCSSKRLKISKEHESFLNKLKLKAKVQHTSKPTFCGWSLCSDGIYKKPQLVLERMCIARETNNLQNCIDNYAIEVAFAYKLGERAVNRMDEEELEAFYNCVRIIVKNKHHCKSDVVNVFRNADI